MPLHCLSHDLCRAGVDFSSCPQGLGHNGIRPFGCSLLSWPLPPPIPATGLFLCAGRRAAFGSSTMDSCGAGRMAQQLRAGAGPAEGSAWRCTGLSGSGIFWQSRLSPAPPGAQPGPARPRAQPSRPGFPSPARVPFTLPGSLHPPMPAARPQGPCLTSRQEDGDTGGAPSPQNPES